MRCHLSAIINAVSSNGSKKWRNPDTTSHTCGWRLFYQGNSEQIKWFCNRQRSIQTYNIGTLKSAGDIIGDRETYSFSTRGHRDGHLYIAHSIYHPFRGA